MRRLRRDCPWKREQTHRSLARYLQEETAETLEAIDTGDADHLREELGDLLLQVYFHAVIAEESGDFTLDDVARGISDKMHRRNPHVFGADGGPTDDDGRRGRRSSGSGSRPSEKASAARRTTASPPGLPALLLATKVLERVPERLRSSRRGDVEPTSVTACSPSSPRPRAAASTPSRPSATPYAAQCRPADPGQDSEPWCCSRKSDVTLFLSISAGASLRRRSRPAGAARGRRPPRIV